MSDNGNGNSNSGDNTSNNIAITALVISIGALITTLLQVFQQYLATADGYRRTAASVMGEWHRGTKRKWNWAEFRYEVIFEAPVIFTAPPENMRGPVKNEKILRVTGSISSYQETQTTRPENMRISNVHTADDEKASWITLLGVLQKAEHDSREWDVKHNVSMHGNKYDHPAYTLCCMLQKKKRSWDFMPSSIIKPFGTTTLCHIVEMMAMLGVYFKQIDVDKGNMRAEGNGQMMTSTLVHGLGILITYAQTGAQKFEENRVIPCDELKQLVFGIVPCILDRKLRLAKEDIAGTLKGLGLTKEDQALFKDKNDRGFLFAIIFELMAMVAKPFRIRGSNFSMLPNPCAELWDPGVDMRKCMQAFRKEFDALYSATVPVERDQLLSLIHDQFAADRLSDDALRRHIDLDLREAAHIALDAIDAHLAKHVRQSELRSVLAGHICEVLRDTSALERAVLLDDESGASKEEKLVKYYFETFKDTVATFTRVGTMSALNDGSPITPRSTFQQHDRSAVWLALNFRMWCWFLLHQFDGNDRMLVPSQFFGSRYPVFIG